MATDSDYSDALKELASRQRAFGKYRRYYDGKQDLHFATDTFRTAFGGLFKTLAYNRCRAVVDAYTNRLQVTGWESPGIEETQTDALGASSMVIWERNRMPRRQGELLAEAMRAGDAYLIVWPDDDGFARIDISRGHLVQPIYSDEYPEQMTCAVKCWHVTQGDARGKWRVNIYEPDGITRLVSKSKSDSMPEKTTTMLSFEDDGFPADVENPYGTIPVFHFANNGDTGMTGVSDLVDVIPLQDGLNKAVADMLVAGEYVAFPQRWVVGVSPSINQQTGQEEESFKAAIDRIWAVDAPDARFGQFDPSDMSQYTLVQDAWDLKISRVSMVPVHWLSMTGSPPSGEALKTAEGPFTAKLKDRQTAFGDTLADAMAFALRVEGVTGDDVSVVPIWAPAETRSDRETWELAMLKQSAGVPDFQIWAEAGYSQQEIAEFTAAKQQAAKEQQEIFAQSFDRGQVPGGDE